MSHQSSHYLKLKGKTYYFSRRVPKVLQQDTSVSRVEICLHTNCRTFAQRQALLCQAPFVCTNFKVVVSGIGGRMPRPWCGRILLYSLIQQLIVAWAWWVV